MVQGISFVSGQTVHLFSHKCRSLLAMTWTIWRVLPVQEWNLLQGISFVSGPTLHLLYQ
jgi:hypothetical protein